MIKHPITLEDPEERIRSLVETCAQMQREIEAYELELDMVVRAWAAVCDRPAEKALAESHARIAAKLSDQPDEPGSRIQ